MILATVYLLSPFPVMWAISRIYGGILNASGRAMDFVMILYYPIIAAGTVVHPIMDFYFWGFHQLEVM